MRYFRRQEPVRPVEPNARHSLDDFGRGFVELSHKLGARSSLEIGAHAAEFSVAMAAELPKVVALEANPYVFETYKARLPYSVTYLQMAASALDGSIDLMVVRKIAPDGRHTKAIGAANQISSILPRTSQKADYERVTVPSATLPTLVAEHALADAALWIDVEGASGQVLAGHESCIRDHFLCVMIEVEERSYWRGQWLRPDVEQFFARSGFSVLASDANGRPQYNLVFVADPLLELARRHAEKAT